MSSTVHKNRIFPKKSGFSDHRFKADRVRYLTWIIHKLTAKGAKNRLHRLSSGKTDNIWIKPMANQYNRNILRICRQDSIKIQTKEAP